MPFPLLDLPPEIREKIYLHTLTSPQPIQLTADYLYLIPPALWETGSIDHPLHPLFPRALLLTCHQVYHEVRPLYFANNSFSFLLMRNPSPLAYFLSPDFGDNRRRIRSFKLVISRWGRHDFFLRELAPLLEDMILNGALRELEVWVRWYNLAPTTELRIGLGDTDVVERLMQILGDPYLEKAVLKKYIDRAHIPGASHSGLMRDITNSVDEPVEDATSLIPFRAQDRQLRGNK